MNEARLRRILLVEDDGDILEYLVFLLNDPRVSILSAPNGREALAMLEAEPVDLIILDAIMPVMGGREFLRRLRQERRSTVPVILSSVDAGIAAEVREMGQVEGTFLKGGDGEDLQLLVRRALALE